MPLSSIQHTGNFNHHSRGPYIYQNCPKIGIDFYKFWLQNRNNIIRKKQLWLETIHRVIWFPLWWKEKRCMLENVYEDAFWPSFCFYGLATLSSALLVYNSWKKSSIILFISCYSCKRQINRDHSFIFIDAEYIQY